MHEATGTRARLESVEGLRAVAALAVFAYHLTWRAPVLRHSFGAQITGHLDTGVEVFFVLSGFLIFAPFAEALVRGRRLPRTGPYAARRITRVWPAFLVALVAVLLLGVGEVKGWTGLLKHGSLTYLYFHDRGGRPLPVAWTLVVEVSFYAGVPLLARLLVPARRRLVEVMVGLALVGAWFQHLTAYDYHTLPSARVLPPALLSLALGMLLAVVRASGDQVRGIGRFVRRLADRPAVPLLIAAAAFVILVVGIKAGTDINSRPADRFAKELLQAVIAGGIALPIVLAVGPAGAWRRFLAHPVMAYLGTVSYGLYLWHLAVLHELRWLLISPHPLVAMLGWLTALGVSIGLAALSWHLVERPALEAVRRRLRRPSLVVASPTG
jgi:peptidoglycan/LPS O-acetylase OafA/YrhL